MNRKPLTLLLVSLAVVATAPAFAQEVSSLAGMEARAIGPAGMSGRIAAIDVVIDDPDVIWAGAATGGVWKSTDGAMTWTPVFDDQPVAAIGAIAIDQSRPDVVWVGTGEGNPRNSASVGRGIYRTRDGGRSWEFLGLGETERIHRIILHPDEPDTAWVSALGRAWGENEERGVFRTTDGGESWEKVLYVDAGTGASDLVIDPRNPDKLIASMWEYRRWPFFFNSGGAGSGIWISVDGGDSWERITAEHGLPDGELGRIGLAISLSHPNTVYALVEAEQSALLRSDDGGWSWSTVNRETGVSPRPFYFSDLRVDPQWPDRIYRVAGSVTISDDGGRTFRPAGQGFVTHPDHHAFWIHPEDPTFILDGNDGGISISRDRGNTWQFVANLPLAQFYHVAVDMDVPYNVYGGLQDNGSWRGPSAVWAGGFFGGGIRNHDWQMVAFGDGFDTRAMPDDPMAGYAMSQGGNLVRWNLRNGVQRAIKPDGPDDEELRFNWNAGLAQDPFDTDVIYYGSQFVHRSEDRGENWTIISPDLTTDEPEWQQQAESGGLTLDVTAAENYTSIIAIAPSPLQEGVIWVGSDDGRLHVTRDGGESWESLEDKIEGVPDHTWIPHIEPSPHDPATAFVVFDDHRRSNWEPYLFKTEDWGATWTNLASDPVDGYALTIVQDPEQPDLLFLGTEFGLWVSFDGGGRWQKWTHGVPTVSVMDLAIHPREHDLVVGTHGRSIFVIDDIRPLRGIASGTVEEPLHLYPIGHGQQYGSFAARGELVPGSTVFVGENRPYGAIISYSMNVEGLPGAKAPPDGGGSPFFPGVGGGGAEAAEQVEIEILDAGHEVVRTMDGPAANGLNRVVWDLAADPFRSAPGGGGGFFGGGGGPAVRPGSYTVRVSYGDHSAEGPVEVLLDPRVSVTDADVEAKWSAIQEMGGLRETGAEALQRLLDGRADVGAAVERAGADHEELAAAGREILARLDEIEKLFRVPPGTPGIPKDDSAMSKVGGALGRLQGNWAAPSDSDRVYMRQARTALEQAVGALNEVLAGSFEAFRERVGAAGIEVVRALESVTIEQP